MTKIAVLVGSLRTDSFNRKLAEALEKMAPDGTEFVYGDLNLPLYNTDLEADFPAEVRTLKTIVDTADGILFVTPEYNRSVPGVLKNAIDWVSRPYGENSFNQKPTGIVGASIGLIGTAVAQSDLRHIGGYLNVRLMGQPELYVALAQKHIDENGEMTGEFKENAQKYINAFTAWVEKERVS